MYPLFDAPSMIPWTFHSNFLINAHAAIWSPSLPVSPYWNGIVTLSLRPVPGFVFETVAFVRAPLHDVAPMNFVSIAEYAITSPRFRILKLPATLLFRPL